MSVNLAAAMKLDAEDAEVMRALNYVFNKAVGLDKDMPVTFDNSEEVQEVKAERTVE